MLRSLAFAFVVLVAAEAREVAVIFVDQDGFCRVQAKELPEGVVGLPVESLVLRHRGDVIDFRIDDANSNDVLDEDDAITFYGERNDSPRTHRSTYTLSVEEGLDEAVRIGLMSTAPVRDSWRFGPGHAFAMCATENLDMLAEGPVNHWVLATIPAGGTVEVPLDGSAAEVSRVDGTSTQRTEFTLRVVLTGYRHPEAENEVTIQIGRPRPGVEVAGRWRGAESHEMRLTVSRQELLDSRGQLLLKVTNHNARAHHNQVGRNLDQIHLVDAVLEAPHVLRERNRPGAAEPPSWVRSFLEPPSELGGGDWLVLTRPAMLGAITPLVEHRRAQGYTPQVVTLDAIFDEYSHGEFELEAIDRFLADAMANWDPPPRCLLLAGDADRDSDRFRPGESVPTRIVEVSGDGGTASDVVYGLIDDDDLPDLAVGRLPASSPEELAVLVAKTIEYETSDRWGDWRRRITLVLGEGRFGVKEDASLQTIATGIVGGYIPPGYDVNVTFAKPGSPYAVAPDRFNDKVIERVNDGTSLLAYIGHGSPTRFDDLRWGGRRYPIIAPDDVNRIECNEGLPVMFVIACSTGHFDDPERECIAEDLLRRPRGPVAIVAASRVSYPYANTVLAKELINVFLRQGERRLGRGLDRMRALLEQGEKGDPLRSLIDFGAMSLLPKPELMARERYDQIFLYNLLGDPALLVSLPGGKIELTAPGSSAAGSTVEVRGKSRLATGRAIVTLEIERTKIAGELEPTEHLLGAHAAAAIERNYERANDKVRWRGEAEVEDGKLALKVELADDLPPGKYFLKVYAYGSGGDALGSRALEILPKGAPTGDEFF